MSLRPLTRLAWGMSRKLAPDWRTLGPRFLPFADAATDDLPLARLLRLSLFQISVGMALALLVGTLNRVMIVELGVGAWLVALMVSLPVLVAPFRALVGFRSDTHRSALGWRRVPYIWLGSFLQFGGLAIMPFALLLLTGRGEPGSIWLGHAGAALAFLLVGAGVQTTQTAGLALATDLASEQTRPRVVALMYVMLLVGMVGAGIVYSIALADFSETRLVQVIAQDSNRRPADAGFCNTWVARYALTIPVLIDPTNTLGVYNRTGSFPMTLVVDRNARLGALEYGASPGLTSLRARIDDLLMNAAD